MNIEQVPTLAVWASQIGPDFYAVLLITVVTAAAGALLLRAQKSKPSLSGEQLQPYRWFFYLSCAFGMAAVVVSIGWWLYKQIHGVNTAQIAITNVAPNIRIDSRYFSKTTLHRSEGDGTLVADEFFLIVNDRPFSDKDNFTFDVFVFPPDASSSQSIACASTGGVTRKESLKIPFSGQLSQSFSLELDSSSLPRLRSDSATSIGQWFSRAEIDVARMLAMRDTK